MLGTSMLKTSNHPLWLKVVRFEGNNEVHYMRVFKVRDITKDRLQNTDYKTLDGLRTKFLLTGYDEKRQVRCVYSHLVQELNMLERFWLWFNGTRFFDVIST